MERLEVLHCATALTQAGGCNRIWQCRAPAVRMYDRGSLFHLRCGQPPALEAIRRVQEKGLGLRRSEGFGQALFLRPALIEGLHLKKALEAREDPGTTSAAELRRARYRWVMEKSKALSGFGLSRSQVGAIQVLCEKAIANGGDCLELNAHLDHNLAGRGAVHGVRFQEAAQLIRAVLDQPLNQTLKIEYCPDSTKARLTLLCLLFDHSRREGRDD